MRAQAMTSPLGVILAGGRAARMGGGDKCLNLIAGQPMLAHIIARLSPQVSRIALNANGDPSRFAAFGLTVLSDPVAGQVGPLAGVLAGLDWAADQGASSIVTIAADTPFFPPDLVQRLQQTAAPAGVCLAATRSGTEAPQIHPTCAIWPVALRDDLRAAIVTGQRKMRDWAGAHRATIAEFAYDNVDPFFNVNTPDQLMMARRLHRNTTSG